MGDGMGEKEQQLYLLCYTWDYVMIWDTPLCAAVLQVSLSSGPFCSMSTMVPCAAIAHDALHSYRAPNWRLRVHLSQRPTGA